MSYPLHPKVEPKKVKNHRKMFFKPTYEVYGFASQAEFDADRWVPLQIEMYSADPSHPFYKRAMDVKALGLKAA